MKSGSKTLWQNKRETIVSVKKGTSIERKRKGGKGRKLWPEDKDETNGATTASTERPGKEDSVS